MECWSDGAMERWGVGVLERRSDGAMEVSSGCALTELHPPNGLEVLYGVASLCPGGTE